MRQIISLKGNDSIKVELGRKGFRLEKDRMVRKGQSYKIPRSIERALKRGDEFWWGNFELKPLPSTKGTSSPFKNGMQLGDSMWVMYEEDGRQQTAKHVQIKPKKKSSPKFILTDKSVSFFHNGSHQASSSNPMFSEIVKELRRGNMDKAIELTNIAKAIEMASDGAIMNDGGVLKYNGAHLHETVQEWILKHMGKGHPAFNAVINFVGRCKNNPNQDSINQLWQFVRANEFIIMPTGEFLAYKYITDDFKDCYSKTFDNGVGQTVSMPRSNVTFDPQKTCSEGLHIARFEYVSGQANIIEVVCCPSNVVSVPVDYNGAKLRCCSYKVWRLIRHKGQDINRRTTQEDFFASGLN